MKVIKLFLLLILPLNLLSAQNLKPYVVGFKSNESISVVKKKLKANLENNKISVVGEYQPASDPNRLVIVFSSDELENSVKKIGGLTGFATTLRIGLTLVNDKVFVSYTNPNYWGNAYFRDDFTSVASNYSTLSTKLENAMKASGQYDGMQFGSEKGKTEKELHKYHYMFGMPYFDDTILLNEFDNYQIAINKIESKIKNVSSDLSLVYRVDIEGEDITLYGFGLIGTDGEKEFLPTIDIDEPKHTAFLPYEILVVGSDVHMLHGRYRIALSFPDLTMATFSKIMSTPGNIKNTMKKLVE